MKQKWLFGTNRVKYIRDFSSPSLNNDLTKLENQLKGIK